MRVSRVMALERNFSYIANVRVLLDHLLTLNPYFTIRRRCKLVVGRPLLAWVQIPGATGAIAPPRICQEGLSIAQAPQENDEIASLL